MLKLLKYELINTRRFVLVLFAIVCAASLLFQLSFKNYDNHWLSYTNGTVISLTMLVFIGAMIVFFFYSAGFLKKDLYTSRGYLTFSLPVDSVKIVGAKTLNAFIWSNLLFFGTLIFNFVLAYILFRPTMILGIEQLIDFYNHNASLFWRMFIYQLIWPVLFYALVFLSIILAKLWFKNPHASILWVIIFMILSYIQDSLSDLIVISGNSTLPGFVVGSAGHLPSPGDYLSNGYLLVTLGSALLLLWISSWLLKNKVEI